MVCYTFTLVPAIYSSPIQPVLEYNYWVNDCLTLAEWFVKLGDLFEALSWISIYTCDRYPLNGSCSSLGFRSSFIFNVNTIDNLGQCQKFWPCTVLHVLFISSNRRRIILFCWKEGVILVAILHIHGPAIDIEIIR